MSHRLISLSPDLKRLRDEEYDIEMRGAYLLVKDVPYVNAQREVARGMLVTSLTMSANITVTPDTHAIYFAGEYPCHGDGSEISEFRNTTFPEPKDLGHSIIVNHQFSAKPYPSGKYENYYDKIMTYINLLGAPARQLDPDVSAKTSPVICADEENDVFKYIDTATSRADIGVVASKLELSSIAIIGLGGTGSYILDHVAKTHVRNIHLFDGDKFLQHNAFRSPGAASLEDLKVKMYKVDYFKDLYSKMRNGIHAHSYYLNGENANELQKMDFVFVCIDGGAEKKEILLKLEEFGVPFIDTGIGINLVDDALTGISRVTTSTKNYREHIWKEERISFADDDGNNEYIHNIQVSDLNALTAALAVIKWKKLMRFYHDLEREHHSTYTISGNKMTNCDKT